MTPSFAHLPTRKGPVRLGHLVKVNCPGHTENGSLGLVVGIWLIATLKAHKMIADFAYGPEDLYEIYVYIPRSESGPGSYHRFTENQVTEELNEQTI